MFNLKVDTPKLRQINENAVFNPWEDTLFENYVYATLGAKGEFGEQYVSDVMESNGCVVESRSNTGHDRTIDGHKVEIKFGLSQRDNKKRKLLRGWYTFNHIALQKDWDRIILAGIYSPDEVEKSTFIWLTKDDIREALEEQEKTDHRTYFSRQQSGNKGNNDDYITGHGRFNRLLASKYCRSMETW